MRPKARASLWRPLAALLLCSRLRTVSMARESPGSAGLALAPVQGMLAQVRCPFRVPRFPSKNPLTLRLLLTVYMCVPAHTHSCTASGSVEPDETRHPKCACSTHAQTGPCPMLGTHFEKVIFDQAQVLRRRLEGLGVQAHSQFSSLEAWPWGQQWVQQPLFWACDMPHLSIPSQC